MIKTKPDLKFNQLWNISFGFFGVQIAFALQQANISGIFSTLGVDLDKIGYFWIVPPLMGMIVQPLVGLFSDKTWNRFGRRLPWLIVGTLIAVLVMTFLPNSGNLGLAANAVFFCVVMFMLLDTSINMAMQPFKMMVGDMVNEKQKTQAYSIQSFLCNAGSLFGYLFPIFFTWIGIANEAPEGVVPDSVVYSFYVGAAILILCVLYTFMKVKEMPPKEYAEFHGFDLQKQQEGKKEGFIKLLAQAPKAFWTVGLVQFFCWAAFLFMWTYTNGAIAKNVWGTTDVVSEGYQAAGNWVGVVFAIQAVGSLCWALFIPKFKTNRAAYITSLVIGAIGFISVFFVHDKYLLFVSYFLIGFAWAAMLALPFSILTNALKGSSHMGEYLGLFNCTICLPQIVAAALGGLVLKAIGGSQAGMLVIAGVLLLCGAVSVLAIKEKHQ